jgi:hypothetical protein
MGRVRAWSRQDYSEQFHVSTWPKYFGVRDTYFDVRDTRLYESLENGERKIFVALSAVFVNVCLCVCVCVCVCVC